MSARSVALACACMAAVSGGACNGILDPSRDDGQQLGVISFYEEDIVIEVPDTVRRAEDFTVLVRTYGGGCIRQGPTHVEVDGLRAAVTPFDIHSGASVCTSELRIFSHEGTVRFERAGTATVTIRGRRRPEDSTITIEHTVVVLE